MVVRRVPLSTGMSESSIVFSSGGGHSHDGISSSLIDTTKYSIYDFTTNFLGSTTRQARQDANYKSFKSVVANIVKTDVLGPAGITPLPGSIKAIHIAANSITSNELAANIVLVNNIIRSNNYVQGESGWKIDSEGNAEFYNISALGYIGATSGIIGGFEINDLNIESGAYYDGTMTIGPAYGPNGSGAVYIEASYAAGVSQYALYSGWGTEYGVFVNNPLSAPYQTLDINSEGIRYQHGAERFEFQYDNGILYAIIDGTPYCIYECGSVPTTVGGTVVVVGGGCSTCIADGEQYAINPDNICGTAGGCFQIWQNYVCQDGCTCPDGCPPVMISDCTGPNCGGSIPPSFFSPPSFFAPPTFFAPPAFK